MLIYQIPLDEGIFRMGEEFSGSDNCPRREEHNSIPDKPVFSFLFCARRSVEPIKKPARFSGVGSFTLCRRWESNPQSSREREFESRASACSATSAGRILVYLKDRRGSRQTVPRLLSEEEPWERSSPENILSIPFTKHEPKV